MRKFLIDISDASKPPQFVDPKDREKYRKLRSRLRSAGKTLLVMELKFFQETTINQKQINLFHVVSGLISKESGTDKDEIDDLLLMNSDIALEDMDNETFNRVLDNAFVIAQKFFNMELTVNSEGFIEQKFEKSK